MAKYVMRDTKTLALEIHYSWVAEDGKGSSKVMYHQATTSPDAGRTTQVARAPLILEPKWAPSEPVYVFPLHL